MKSWKITSVLLLGMALGVVGAAFAVAGFAESALLSCVGGGWGLGL